MQELYWLKISKLTFLDSRYKNLSTIFTQNNDGIFVINSK